jgi:amino-acid N-acetyltransferase
MNRVIQMIGTINYIDALTDIHSRQIMSELLQSEGLCYDDLAEIDGELKLAIDDKGNVIGGYGLEIYEKDALLRSIFVSKEYRGSGKGIKIVQEAIDKAKDHGVEQLFLLTTNADTFFLKFGLIVIPRTAVPDSISSTNEFKTFCPDTAVCMKYKI